MQGGADMQRFFAEENTIATREMLHLALCHSVPTLACVWYVLSPPRCQQLGVEHRSSSVLIHGSQRSGRSHQLGPRRRVGSASAMTLQDAVISPSVPLSSDGRCSLAGHTLISCHSGGVWADTAPLTPDTGPI